MVELGAAGGTLGTSKGARGLGPAGELVGRCIVAAWPDGTAPSVTRSTRFDELGVDSVGLIEIVYSVEQALEREFSEAELLSIETVGDLCRLAEAAR